MPISFHKILYNTSYILFQDYNYQESQGDGDLVANPGETIELVVTVENLIPWDDASNTDMILSTNDPYLEVINDYVDEKDKTVVPDGFSGFVSKEDKEKELFAASKITVKAQESYKKFFDKKFINLIQNIN